LVTTRSFYPSPKVSWELHPDDEANYERWFRDQARCVELRPQLTCATDRQARIGVSQNPMTGLTGCHVFCADRRGDKDGEFIQRTVGKRGSEETIRGRYAHGKPVGQGTHESSSSPSREEFYDEHGHLHGRRLAWSPSGKLLARENLEHGLRRGAYEAWHANGARQTAGQFTIGASSNHLQSLWIPGPFPMARGVEVFASDAGRGVPVGVWLSWFPNGARFRTQSFGAMGQPSGESCRYAASGELVECTTTPVAEDWPHQSGPADDSEERGTEPKKLAPNTKD
jgi:hypothetical protein